MSSKKTKIFNDISDKKYVMKWGEKYSTLMVDMFARINISYPDMIKDEVSDYITFVLHRKKVEAYFSQESLEEIQKNLGSYFLRKERIKKVFGDYERIIKELDNFFSKIKKSELSKVSDEKIYTLFKKYVSLMEEAFTIFRMTRAEAEAGPSCKIEQVLEKYYKKQEVDKIYAVLVESPTIDMISKERIAWLKILENRWDKKEVVKYVMKFAANFVNMYEISEIIKFLKKRYSKDKLLIDEVRKEVEKGATWKRKIKSQQKQIYKHCDSNKELITFSQMLQQFGVLRFDLKYAWAGAELHCLELFQEICKRMRVSLKDFFDLYLVADVFSFFESGRLLSRTQIAKREKCILIRVSNNKLYEVFEGSKALKIVNQLKEFGQTGTEDKLQGVTAFPGYAKGQVRIVHSTDISELSEISKKFNKGDILVSENTQPAMIVLMKKSGAIITDIGGLTCHAAIVSREFKIPCIIGTKIATRVLSDGQLVEVDAEEGVVKIIK